MAVAVRDSTKKASIKPDRRRIRLCRVLHDRGELAEFLQSLPCSPCEHAAVVSTVITAAVVHIAVQVDTDEVVGLGGELLEAVGRGLSVTTFSVAGTGRSVSTARQDDGACHQLRVSPMSCPSASSVRAS